MKIFEISNDFSKIEERCLGSNLKRKKKLKTKRKPKVKGKKSTFGKQCLHLCLQVVLLIKEA